MPEMTDILEFYEFPVMWSYRKMEFSHIAGWMQNGSMFSNNFQFLIYCKKPNNQENPFLGLLDHLYLVSNNILLKGFSLELLSLFLYSNLLFLFPEKY